MKGMLENAIKELTEQSAEALDATNAMKFSQAVLNLINAYERLICIEIENQRKF